MGRSRMKMTKTGTGRQTAMNNLNDIFFAPTENGALTYEQVLEDVQRYFPKTMPPP